MLTDPGWSVIESSYLNETPCIFIKSSVDAFESPSLTVWFVDEWHSLREGGHGKVTGLSEKPVGLPSHLPAILPQLHMPWGSWEELENTGWWRSIKVELPCVFLWRSYQSCWVKTFKSSLGPPKHLPVTPGPYTASKFSKLICSPGWILVKLYFGLLFGPCEEKVDWSVSPQRRNLHNKAPVSNKEIEHPLHVYTVSTPEELTLRECWQIPFRTGKALEITSKN